MNIRDMVAWWKLDETEGVIAYDSSDNRYNGTYVNSPTLNQIGAFGISKAVTFASASSQAVSVAAVDLSATSAITVAVWVKTSAASGVFVEGTTNMNSNTDGFYLGISTANQIEAIHKGNAGYNQILQSTALDGRWKHLVAVYDKSQPAANEVALYINGSFVTYTNGISNNNTNSFGNKAVYLASRATTSMFLNGTLDDVRIYNRALTSDEISLLYYWSGDEYMDVWTHNRNDRDIPSSVGTLSIPNKGFAVFSNQGNIDLQQINNKFNRNDGQHFYKPPA